LSREGRVPYSLYRNLTGNGALIKKVSHWDVNLNKGVKLPPDFETPVVFKIDPSTPGREMPTLFAVPAFVARPAFHDALVAAGADNVDAYPAVIRDENAGRESTDYRFLNVVGVVSCADLAASDSRELGPGVRIVDRIVMERARVPRAHIFRLAEDKLRVVVSDEVHEKLAAAGFDDVYFQPVEVR
jgi:hypothetical protein